MLLVYHSFSFIDWLDLKNKVVIPALDLTVLLDFCFFEYSNFIVSDRHGRPQRLTRRRHTQSCAETKLIFIS